MLASIPVTRRESRVHHHVEYDTAAVTVLGARPLTVKAEMYNATLVAIEVELPLDGSYDSAFRQAFPGQRMDCDEGDCRLYGPESSSIGDRDGATLEVTDDNVLLTCSYDY
jgi:hypothetical protein